MRYIYKIVSLEARIANEIFISFLLNRHIKNNYMNRPLRMPSDVNWSVHFHSIVVLSFQPKMVVSFIDN